MFLSTMTLAVGLTLVAPPEPPKHSEFYKMLAAVLSGSRMGPGDGWFAPSESRHDWNWLAAKHDLKAKEELRPSKFRGPRELFAALDRDGNGLVRDDDFDWSDDSPFVKQLDHMRQWVARGDRNNDRKLTKEEWDAIFQRAAAGKDHLLPEDVRTMFFPPPPSRQPSPPPPGMMPSQRTLLKGLFNGELGSAQPGPELGTMAPDFTLTTENGKKTVTLSDYRGKKPVVLIFGSFT